MKLRLVHEGPRRVKGRCKIQHLSLESVSLWLKDFYVELLRCQVDDRLIALMQQAYRRVHEASESRGLDMRGAALRLGIERIAAAKRTRGIFP